MGIEKGFSKSGDEQCPTCGGEGTVPTVVENNTEKQVRKDICGTCHGNGRVRAKK